MIHLGTSDRLALPGSLVDESQLRIPKLEPDIIFTNRVVSRICRA